LDDVYITYKSILAQEISFGCFVVVKATFFTILLQQLYSWVRKCPNNYHTWQILYA